MGLFYVVVYYVLGNRIQQESRTMTANTFTVARDDIRTIRTIDDGSAAAPLEDGTVRLRAGPFSLTSNNVTYGALGVAMNYFGFYPAPDPEQGRIPVWGFADVVESRVSGVTEGERFFGYFPPSSHAVLQPVRVTDSGFFEGGEHRKSLPAIYNQYTRCSTDPGYEAQREPQIALLRPLFATAFLLDDFIAQHDFHGARSVVFSSASSKTAYSTAFLLAQRAGVKVVGLTSPRNAGFVRALGCYDETVTHGAIGDLPITPTVFVDLSGAGDVRAALRTRYGDSLKYACAVGSTHWNASGARRAFTEPGVELFLAANQAKRRADEWGREVLSQRIGQAWQAFMKPVCDPQTPWVRIVSGDGLSAVVETYQALLEGRVRAEDGHVLTI